MSKQNEEINVLKDVVYELTEDNKKDNPNNKATNVRVFLEDEDTEISENDSGAAEDANEEADTETADNDTEAAENDNVADLLRMKQSGHNRVGPQVLSQPKSTEVINTEFKCEICKLKRDSKAKLERHMKNHNDDGDWTCDGCAYQTSEETNLLNHLLEKRDHSTKLLDHLLNKNIYERKGKCNLCGESFESKTNLHNHLFSNHKTYKPCNKMPSCSGLECRFNHNQVGKDVHLCYQCGDEFNSRMGLMEHMKVNHRMPPCKHFQSGNCTFHQRCWYPHEKVTKGVQTTSPKNAPNKTPIVPDFWGQTQNNVPPSTNTIGHQQMIEKMMEMNQKIMKDMMGQMNQQMMNMMSILSQKKN